MSKMLTFKEAAERLGIHLNTLRKYIDRGDLPIFKLDKAVRIDEKDLENFIKAKRIKK